MRYGREVTCALPSGTKISKGIRDQEPKICFGAGKTPGNLQITSLNSSMAAGVHSGRFKSNVMPRRCLGRRYQTRSDETRCSRVKLLSRAGEGEAVAAVAARKGSEMAATSGAFAGGWTAGALLVPRKTAMGATFNGTWATPRRSPGSKSVAPLLGRTCRPKAAKCCSAQEERPAGAAFRRQ